jgi:hypothetical protein
MMHIDSQDVFFFNKTIGEYLIGKNDKNEMELIWKSDEKFRLVALVVIENLYRMNYIRPNQNGLILNFPNFNEIINIFYMYPTNLILKRIENFDTINFISIVDSYKNNIKSRETKLL